jgi:hypothetical protein
MKGRASFIALGFLLVLAIGCQPAGQQTATEPAPTRQPPAAQESPLALATETMTMAQIERLVERLAEMDGHGEMTNEQRAALRKEVEALEPRSGTSFGFHLDYRGGHHDVQMLVLRQEEEQYSVRFEARDETLLRELDRIQQEVIEQS